MQILNEENPPFGSTSDFPGCGHNSIVILAVPHLLRLPPYELVMLGCVFYVSHDLHEKEVEE